MNKELYLEQQYFLSIIKKQLKPYNNLIEELLITLPRRFIETNKQFTFQYLFDGKWITQEELVEIIYKPILDIIEMEKKIYV